MCHFACFNVILNSLWIVARCCQLWPLIAIFLKFGITWHLVEWTKQCTFPFVTQVTNDRYSQRSWAKTIYCQHRHSLAMFANSPFLFRPIFPVLYAANIPPVTYQLSYFWHIYIVLVWKSAKIVLKKQLARCIMKGYSMKWENAWKIELPHSSGCIPTARYAICQLG